MSIITFLYLLCMYFFIFGSGIISAVVFHIAKYSEFLGFVIGTLTSMGLFFGISSAVIACA
jgi:hypothetical protein